MIPIADESPSMNTPYVVYGLIIVNIIVFLIDRIGVSGPVGHLWQFSMIPYSVIHNTRILFQVNQFGQIVDVQRVAGGIHPQWITIFTSMFMHASFWHIAGNMLYLWIFGNNIEDLLGHWKLFVFYILCGLLAAVAHIAASANSLNAIIPTLGASGAIAGVLGAYIVLYPGSRVKTLLPLIIFYTVVDLPAAFVLGEWFVLQLLGIGGSGGMQGGGVAYWAHVGGFVSGAVIVLLAGGRRRARRRRRPPLDDYHQKPYPWRPWS